MHPFHLSALCQLGRRVIEGVGDEVQEVGSKNWLVEYGRPIRAQSRSSLCCTNHNAHDHHL
jgi:hypothetical protein